MRKVNQILDDLEATARLLLVQVRHLQGLGVQAPMSLAERKRELERLAERLRALTSEVYALEVEAKRPLEDNSAEALRRELGLFL
ncbi:hypothetical protein [Fervidobacterium sp.]